MTEPTPTAASPAPAAPLPPAEQVEEMLFDACETAFGLAEAVSDWHEAGRPELFQGGEPELSQAMHAMADRLVVAGPISAARALGDVMPPDLWLILEDASEHDVLDEGG